MLAVGPGIAPDPPNFKACVLVRRHPPKRLYVPHSPSPASSGRVGAVVVGDTTPSQRHARHPPREASVRTSNRTRVLFLQLLR